MNKLVSFLYENSIINQQILRWLLNKGYIDFFTYYRLIFKKDV